MRTITNDSGTYYIDNNGVLLHYESADININNYFPDKKGRNIVNLTIPEGVQELPADAFRGYDIGCNLKLPGSLKRLGAHVFSGSHIGGIKLPERPDPDMMRQLAHRMRFVHVWTDYFIDRWPQECKDIYMGKSEPRESWQRIYNDSGIFWIDSDGVLMDLVPTHFGHKPIDDERIFYDLDIPEGVTAIPSEMFRHYIIYNRITLPKSLRCIAVGYGAGCAFSDSWLPDLVLPENLEVLGDYAFGSTVIRSVTIPHDPEKILPLQARQFKGANIGEIRVPIRYRDVLQGYMWKDGHEVTDPVFGQLYCAKAAHGGEAVMVYVNAVAHQLRAEDKECPSPK